MRRIGGAALTAVLALATIGAGSALAAYTDASAEVSFYGNTGQYLGTDRATVACSTTSCSVTVHMSRAHRSRFVRQCGSATVDVVVPALDIAADAFCGLGDGPPYGGYVQIRASMLDSGASGWGDSDVHVAVTAVAP